MKSFYLECNYIVDKESIHATQLVTRVFAQEWCSVNQVSVIHCLGTVTNCMRQIGKSIQRMLKYSSLGRGTTLHDVSTSSLLLSIFMCVFTML